mmetsp:Transcript_36016/g.89814  ORF Transcript_36016/g.89814 Transcript_36016/m.89814 type:complete len:272 (-) Transcript_36016:668-1483(-)
MQLEESAVEWRHATKRARTPRLTHTSKLIAPPHRSTISRVTCVVHHRRSDLQLPPPSLLPLSHRDHRPFLSSTCPVCTQSHLPPLLAASPLPHALTHKQCFHTHGTGIATTMPHAHPLCPSTHARLRRLLSQSVSQSTSIRVSPLSISGTVSERLMSPWSAPPPPASSPAPSAASASDAVKKDWKCGRCCRCESGDGSGLGSNDAGKRMCRFLPMGGGGGEGGRWEPMFGSEDEVGKVGTGMATLSGDTSPRNRSGDEGWSRPCKGGGRGT